MLPQKRGDTFDRLTQIPETYADGSPAFPDGYFVGWTVTSQVRTTQNGTLLADLDCEWVDPVTTRMLSVKAVDTRNWVVGIVEMDIQFTRVSDGYTRSTSTIKFSVTPDVTRDGP